MHAIRRFILAACLLAVGAPSHALTLAQLITSARTLALDAASSSRQRFSDSQITQFINDGQSQAISQTRCLRNSVIFQLQTGSTYYAMPSGYLTINRVTIGSKWIQEMSPAALDGRSRGWEASSGYPTYYFVNFSSRNYIGFAPFPQTSTDTDTVKVEYSVQANQLSSSTDVPFNGSGDLYDFHQGLAYYSAAMMSAIEGQTQRATSFLGVYTAVMGQMEKRCLERPNYMPSGTGSN